jgi:hypothetical protein
MAVVNTLAYYDTATITVVKGFIVQHTGDVFTTLHFLHNLQIGPISLIFLSLAGLSSLVKCNTVAYWTHLLVASLAFLHYKPFNKKYYSTGPWCQIWSLKNCYFYRKCKIRSI